MKDQFEELDIDIAQIDGQIAELLTHLPAIVKICEGLVNNGFSAEEAHKVAMVLLLRARIKVENFIGQMHVGTKVNVNKTLPPLAQALKAEVPVSEESTMQGYLDLHPCECGGKRELTGEAMYTDPIGYAYQCATCSKEGMVGYSDLQHTSIEDRPNY